MKPLRQHLPFKAAIAIAFCLVFFNINAKEFAKEFTGSKTVSSTDKINLLINHTNNATIHTTDKAEFSFKINITIDGDESESEEILELLESLKFEIKDKADGLSLECYPFSSYSISGGLKSSLVVKLKDGKKYKFSKKTRIKREVEIFTPRANPLNLKASFSKVDLGELANGAAIELSHSTLKANNFQQLKLKGSFSTMNFGEVADVSNVSLSHSKFIGLSLNKAKVGLDFSTFDVERCTSVAMERAQHSKVEIDKVNSLTVQSSSFTNFNIESIGTAHFYNEQHGTLNFESLNSLQIDKGGFTRISLDFIHKSLVVNASHSNISVGSLEPSLQKLEINNSFATVSLGAEQIPNYTILISGGRNSSIKPGRDVTKKADGYYVKNTTGETPIEFSLKCQNCTVKFN
jgi:hypothetical protein